MPRRKPAAAVNYWPGYVDAMTNVVLNLLFMVAIFGISVFVANGLNTGRPPETSAIPPRPSPPPGPTTPPPPAGNARIGERPGPKPLPLPAATVVARAAPVEAPTPRTAAVSAETADIVVADAYRRAGGPEVRIVRRSYEGGSALVLRVPVGVDPMVALARPGLADAVARALPADARFVIWTAADPNDEGARRVAYLLVTNVREILIRNGANSHALIARIYPGGAMSPTTRDVYIVPAPTTPAGT